MKKIRFIPLAVIILLFCSFNVSAEEDFECSLAEDVLESPFLLEGAGIVTLESPEIPDGLTFNHTIKLANGMIVSYSAGGCVHYRQFFEFSHVPFEFGEALDDVALQYVVDLFYELPLKEHEKEMFLANIAFLHEHRNDPDAVMCDDCSDEQAGVYDENGQIILLDIDGPHAFSLHTDFPL